MDKETAMTPTPKYRDLGPDEVTQPGDEWSSDSGEGEWLPVVTFQPISKFLFAHRFRRPIADTPDPGGQEKQYPCDKCGTLRTESEGGTVFTVCDKCWDEKPVQPEQIHRNTDTMENEVARCAECNCELASFEVDGQSIAGCPVCKLRAELSTLRADKARLEAEIKELREESTVAEQCAAHVEETLGYVFPGSHSWLELVDAADVRIKKLESENARLLAGGCARDQTTTQFCAEAVRLQQEKQKLEGVNSDLLAACKRAEQFMVTTNLERARSRGDLGIVKAAIAKAEAIVRELEEGK